MSTITSEETMPTHNYKPKLTEEQRGALIALRDCGVVRAYGDAQACYNELVRLGLASVLGYDYRLTDTGRAAL